MNIRPFLLSGWNDLDPSTPQRGRALALAQVTASMASTAWVVAVACCLGSHFGTLPNAGGFASCWPAAALALVAVLWRGSWALPGVLLGRLLFDALPTGLAGPQALGIGQASLLLATLSTVQAGLGAWALRRWCPPPMGLIEPGPILRLFTLVGASSLLCGSYTLVVRYVPTMGSNLFWLWLTAVAGDLLAVLLLTPALLLSLQRDERSRPRLFWLWLLLGVGYLLSWCGSAWIVKLEESRIRTQWRMMQSHAQHNLQTELRRHELMLDSLTHQLTQTPVIDRSSFAQSALPLLGLSTQAYALSWNPVVSRSQRAGFEAAQSQQYLRPWRIMERDEQGLRVAGPRNFHVPVQAIEPAQDNPAALGFDVYADPVRQAAVETSLHTGRLSATQPLRLVQRDVASFGVMAFKPVPGAAPPAGASSLSPLARTRGFAVAVLPLEHIAAQEVLAQHSAAPSTSMQTELDSLPRISQRSVNYRLLDLDAPPGEQTVWQFDGENEPSPEPPQASPSALLRTGVLPVPQRFEMSFAGRHYRLESAPRPEFWSTNLSLWPYTVFTACLWMTVACNVILLLFTGHRESLALEVEERTADLLQSQYSLTETMHYAQTKSDQLGFLLQQTPVGFLGFDDTGRYLLGNQALLDMLGIGSLEDIPNINVFISLLVQRLPGISLQRLFALGDSRQGQPAPELQLNRVRLLTPQGQTRHVTLQAMKYPVGPVRHLFTLVDLSSDVALESSKSEFISLVAHEIRTPLTSVQGYAELLLARPGLEVAQRQELAGAISTQARQIQTLLTKMLNLSELEVGGVEALKPRVMNIQQWLPQALKAFRTPAGRQPPALRLADDALYARIDPRKLERAVTELLDNAYSFSGPEAPVQLHLQRSRGPDGRPELTLAVIDQGLGMDDTQRSRACDKFYRVDKSGEKPGCGLGLPLVKLIAELHHGRLVLSATSPGPGLVAAISLPLSVPA